MDKQRDAERSRAAILAAAESLFAAQGFNGTSLGEIAEAAGLSRGTPSYFYGSKEALYRAVLEGLFRERDRAAREAFEPLAEWSAAASPEGSLRAALTQAVIGYLDFLRARPEFARLVQREGLAGGARLARTPRESKAVAEGFAALRKASPKRGLRRFAVDDAVLVFISLTFSPATQRSTFMASLGRDLDDPTMRRAHVELVVDQLLHLVGAPEGA